MARSAARRGDHEHVDAIRQFNRFYTRRIGVLEAGLLDTPFSLAEARVLYEIAHGDAPTASAIVRELGLDAGYVSRMVRRFEQKALLTRRRSATDSRQSLLTLTAAGRKAAETLDRRSQDEVATLLRDLADPERRQLVSAMETIHRLLGQPEVPREPYLLRPPSPGDMGWVIARHGALYAREYGWDASFEGLVAGIVGDILKSFDPARERIWIAERGGENVGSIFLVRKTRTVAKLRLLIVDPDARGFGIGRRLVQECIRFAHQVGYRRITLWTNSILHAARHLYVEAGFKLVHEEAHHSFGRDLVGETWELNLDDVESDA